MGVSGCGKSSVAARLAQALGCDLIRVMAEGDDAAQVNRLVDMICDVVKEAA